MLRLAPSRPLLWRTETSLQLGGDAVVRVDAVTPWQERLLDALRGGIADDMLIPYACTLGAKRAEAESFAQHIRPALVPAAPVPLPVRAVVPADLSHGEFEAAIHGWRAGGLDVRSVTRWHDEAADPSLPAIIVADGSVEPRHAAALMATDAPHVPIELAGDRVVVGPGVLPGRTGCLACRHAHRTDADPDWPLIAAQLVGRTRERTDAGLVIEAAVLAARLLRPLARGEGTDTTVSVTLSCCDVRRVWHAHRPHARCLCRSHPESASAGADDARSAAPTTATAYDLPA